MTITNAFSVTLHTNCSIMKRPFSCSSLPKQGGGSNIDTNVLSSIALIVGVPLMLGNPLVLARAARTVQTAQAATKVLPMDTQIEEASFNGVPMIRIFDCEGPRCLKTPELIEHSDSTIDKEAISNTLRYPPCYK